MNTTAPLIGTWLRMQCESMKWIWVLSIRCFFNIHSKYRTEWDFFPRNQRNGTNYLVSTTCHSIFFFGKKEKKQNGEEKEQKFSIIISRVIFSSPCELQSPHICINILSFHIWIEFDQWIKWRHVHVMIVWRSNRVHVNLWPQKKLFGTKSQFLRRSI